MTDDATLSRSALKDQVFLRMASELSRLGTCCRLKVGAVLLRPDGGVASAGFNGALPGMPHCTPDTCKPGQRCLHTSHAEENALGCCDGHVAVAYVTHEPCLACTRSLVRRGVRRVVFQHPYSSIAEQEAAERASILRHFSVQWEQLELA